MATFAVHFLTIVGRPGEEAAAGLEKLVASRLRLARTDPEGDFEGVADPLRCGSVRDEQTIGDFCRGLLANVRRLPTIGYSQFVLNFAGPWRVIDMLGPRADRSCGPGRQALHGYNFQLACFRKRDTEETFRAIGVALARTAPDGGPAYRSEGRMFLEHLRAAHEIAPWVPFTVVVIEECIGATREDFEIEAAMEVPLDVRHPIYYEPRPAAPADRDGIVDVWLRSVRATQHLLGEEDIAAMLPVVREQMLSNLEVTVVTADDDPAPVGFCGMDRNTIKALFVDPAHQRRGAARLLVRDAARQHGNLRVDVHEQSPGAIAFFESMGFRRVGRSELDGLGRPLPVLHLSH